MASTINALAMKITLNTREVTAGSNQMRKDMRQMEAVMRKGRTDADKYKTASEALARQFQAGAMSAREFRDALATVHEQYISGPKRIAREREEQARANKMKEAAARVAKKKAEAERKAAEAARVAAQKERELLAIRNKALSVLQRNETALERYHRTVRDLRNALKAGAISQQELNKAMAVAGREYNRAALASKDTSENVKGADGSLASFGKTAGKFVAAAAIVQKLKQIGTAFFNAGIEMEKARAAFEVYTGSLESGNRTLNEMRELAAGTPLQFEQVQRAAQTMLGFGVEAENLRPILQQLGDIAAGDNDRFQRLSLAMSQISAAGKLMGQDLNQLIQAGFNPLQELSRTTGVSYRQLRKEMEAGNITFADVQKAMASITSEGGRANGAMERFAKTTGGAISQATGELQALVSQLGESALGMSGLADAARGFAKQMRWIREWIYGTEEAAKSAEEAAKKADEFYHATMPQDQARQKEIDAAQELMRLAKERQALRLGQGFVEFNEFAQSGATPGQIEEFKRLRKSIRLIKERQELEQKITQENERRAEIVKSLQDQGRALMEQHNPVKAVEKQIGDLLVLLRVGAINEATFFKERNKILAEQVKDIADAGPAESLQAGSAQAAQMLQERMADEQNKQLAKLEALRLEAQAQTGAMNRMERRLAELRPVGTLR